MPEFVRPADHHADILLHAIRQEAFERLLFEQRITTRQKKYVEIARARQSLCDIPFVDAGADRLDGAALAQCDQRPITALHELLDTYVRRLFAAMGEYVDVMSVDDVDVVDSQAARKREFKRAHDAIVGIVETFAARRRLEKGALARSLLGRA